MGAGVRLRFLVDEHLPVAQLRAIMEPRAHAGTPVVVATKDAEILATAEATGGIVLTADAWFLEELFRFPLAIATAFGQRASSSFPGHAPPPASA